MIRAFGLTGLLLLALTSAAAAQQPTQQQGAAIRSACGADYRNVCAGVPTGGSASLACLQQHAASVSAPCQQALAAVGGAPAPAAPAPEATTPAAPAPAPPPPARAASSPHMTLAQACAHDRAAYCGRFAPGTLRAGICLRDNESRLSRSCRMALEMAREKAQSAR